MIKRLLLFILICINYCPMALSLDIPKNERIDHWIKEFSQSRRQFFQLSIMRSGLYRSTVLNVLEKEKLPADLSWLPFIESGFNCAATSTAKAAGCWQFIKTTGKAYGLNKGVWKDQRYDFNRSTVAAAKYLKRLYKMFGNWDLALSAYNCGPGRVRSAIKKSGKDYWYLDLPSETMDYIPKFYAVIKITRDLEQYGFKESSGDLIIVQLRTGSHNLRYIADRILKVDYKVFLRLNPGYEIGYTPPGESTSIYLMKDWDIVLLRGFGLLAKKNALRID